MKVWLGLRQVGRKGYAKMIGDDIRLSMRMHELIQAEGELQAVHAEPEHIHLPFCPAEINPDGEKAGEYLNKLNTELVAASPAGR
jgi:aromatic-L-amino-acid/L-tryptophan decarboxylase